jgi:NSS family neurotransmitter:Na+ symporter
MARQQWGNRGAFVLAAIGSAAGLGNIWRFPYIVYQNGGGAFLIPYFIAILTAGLPLLILEFSMGQKNQLGAPGAMASVKKKFGKIGWWTVLSAFIIVTYYAVIMGWSIVYLVDSFTGTWIDTGVQEYFYENVLQLSSGPGDLGGFSIPVLLGVVLTWILIYFILRKGTESVGKVVWFTVLAPIGLLVVLIVRAVTLPGAMSGLNYFLQPDFSRLLDYHVWIDAYSQVFFTLSLGMGIMFAYSSYQPKDSDITNNALITVLANTSISFMSGIAVFGTLGYMSVTQGVPISEVATSGIGLAFEVFPTAIKLLPGGPAVVTTIGVIFFLTLLTLGIDSAFSLVESNITAFVDKFKWDKRKVTLWVIVVLGIVSLLFTTEGGLYWLDIIDHYINNYGLVLGGILEAIVIGWYYYPEKLRSYVNSVSEYRIGKWWNTMIKYIVPIILTIFLIYNFIGDITKPYGDYALRYQWLGGWGMLIALLIVVTLLNKIGNRNITEVTNTDQALEEN